MSGIEAVLLAAAKTIAGKAATTWLALQREGKDRSSDLSGLIETSFRDKFIRRKFEVQLEAIATDIAIRLRVASSEFSSLETNEAKVAVAAAVDIFTQSNVLSDKGLLDLDVSASKISAHLQDSAKETVDSLGLGELGERLCRVVLDECAECFVEIVRNLPSFSGRIGPETLARLSRISMDIGEVLSRLPERRADDYSSDPDGSFTARYLRFVEQYYDSLELFGVDVRNYSPQTTLSIAYLSLSVTDQSGEGKANQLSRSLKTSVRARVHPKDDSEEYTGVRVEAALARGNRVLIRGEAGSGKSTLLRWIAVTAARSRFNGDLVSWNASVPLIVKLRSHANRPLPSLSEIAADLGNQIGSTTPPNWVNKVFDSGRALLLVDGVDELVASQRSGVRKWLRGILATYPDTIVVVTSRPTAASDRWLATEGFSSVAFERMTPSDTAIFISRWHDAISASPHLPCKREDLPRFQRRLVNRLEANHHIRGLATNPLMCAMLCALNLDRHDDLPHDRMSLYRAALDMLLERRDSVREVPSYRLLNINARDSMSLLQDLAWRLALSNRSEMESEQAREHVQRRLRSLPQVTHDADQVFYHLLDRSGVLREPAQDRIAFIHRTFQEYLTAKEISEEDYIDALLERAHRDIWRETVIMTAGHANSRLRERLIDGLLDRAQESRRHARRLRLLAAACIETAPTMSPALLSRVDECIKRLLPPKTSTEASSLALAGERVLTLLPDTLSHLTPTSASAVVEATTLINGPRALDKLARYGSETRADVIRALAHAASYFDPDEFGRKVLADSPLINGALPVVGERALPMLKHLKHLRGVDLYAEGATTTEVTKHLPPLASLGLRNIQANDLSSLETQPNLTSLVVVADTQMDLSTLPNLPNLRNLTADAGRGLLRGYEHLADLPWLRSLSLSDIEDLTELNFLSELCDLTELDLYWGISLADTSFLLHMPKLEALKVAGCGDPHVLANAAGSGAPITDLQAMRVAGLTELAPLAAFKLEHLDLDGCIDLMDLGPLSTQKELQTLDLRSCPLIADLEPLSNLTKLEALYLSSNRPLDLGPLPRVNDLMVSVPEGQPYSNADGLRIKFRPHRESGLEAE